MEEQNRKNTGSEKVNLHKADREKMRELARKKKELEEELDELKGNTAKGKAVCTLVFLLLMGLVLSLSVGMVKLDVGGVASTLLAPLIGDIPVARSILPAELQRKSPSELAAEQAAAEAESQAASQAAAEAESQAAAEAESQAAAEAEAQAASQVAEAQAQAASQAAEAQAEAEAAAALQDYVDTYSAMKPQDAAKLFESMLPDKEDIVVDILKNLTPEGRAAILSSMDVTNAANLTEKMRQSAEAKAAQ